MKRGVGTLSENGTIRFPMSHSYSGVTTGTARILVRTGVIFRTEDPSRSLSVEELANFMAQWHRLFLEDSKYVDRLFPNLGSGDVHCRHFDSSLSFAFTENGLILEVADI